MGENIENTWDAETARKEFRRTWNDLHDVLTALRDMPPTIPGYLQIVLSYCGKWPSDKNLGDKLQMDKASGWHIPFKSECELGAGFWSRIQTAHARAEAAEAESARLRKQIEAVKEALTPSPATKAAYIGEFSFYKELGAEGEGFTISVPWTTIKEIMAAIRAKATLASLT